MIKAYKDITIAGRVIYNRLGPSTGDHTGKRAPHEKPSSESVKAYNNRQAARKMAIKIDTNFGPGDSFITLTYTPEERELLGEGDEAFERAERDLTNFLRRARYQMKKRHVELKWMARTEQGELGGIHHHVIININDLNLITGLWDKGHPNVKKIYKGSNKRLGEYFVKGDRKTFSPREKGKHRYRQSRNIIMPVTKRLEIDASELLEEPEPIKGYYIPKDSVERYETPTGLPVVEYIQLPLYEPRRFHVWPAGKKIQGWPYYIRVPEDGQVEFDTERMIAEVNG